MRIAIYHRKLEEAAQKQLENLMTILRNNHIDAYEIDPLSPENLDADMLFSIGGDGTLLSSVHLIGDSGIPVIGINYGHLGFLTTVGQDDSPETFVHDLLAGNYTIEERTMLHISSPQLSGLQHTALNEVYLRRESADLLRVSLYVDDEFVATYDLGTAIGLFPERAFRWRYDRDCKSWPGMSGLPGRLMLWICCLPVHLQKESLNIGLYRRSGSCS